MKTNGDETERWRIEVKENRQRIFSFASSLSRLFAGLISLTLLAACGTALSEGHGTALDSFDLESMTGQMAAGIVGDPRVQAEIAAHGPLKIVCEAVENRMTGEILPQGQAEAYTANIRALLSKHAPDQFTWIMNRDEYHALRDKEVDLGPSPDVMNPQYALAATFQTITQEDEEHRSAYYLCVYRLTDLDHRTVLWTGTYKVKKNVVKEFLD